MFKSIQAGEIEYIFPDENMKEIILKVINQNQAIIETNKTLIESLAKPLMYIEPEK